jgi:hypothetical protein
MPNKFEPYNKKQGNDNEFNVWEYQVTTKKDTEEPVVIDKKDMSKACNKHKPNLTKKRKSLPVGLS